MQEETAKRDRDWNENEGTQSGLFHLPLASPWLLFVFFVFFVVQSFALTAQTRRNVLTSNHLD